MHVSSQLLLSLHPFAASGPLRFPSLVQYLAWARTPVKPCQPDHLQNAGWALTHIDSFRSAPFFLFILSSTAVFQQLSPPAGAHMHVINCFLLTCTKNTLVLLLLSFWYAEWFLCTLAAPTILRMIRWRKPCSTPWNCCVITVRHPKSNSLFIKDNTASAQTAACVTRGRGKNLSSGSHCRSITLGPESLIELTLQNKTAPLLTAPHKKVAMWLHQQLEKRVCSHYGCL